MNPDQQSMHKSNGSQHGKISHRPLNEEVLQSAVEAAKDEVFNTTQPYQRDAHPFYLRAENRVTRFVWQEPMKAAVMAAGVGALLALALETSLKRMVSLLLERRRR
jgi:hypothetical protein